MNRVFKDKFDFIDMHKVSTNNQENILKITKKNMDTLININKKLELINRKIDKIEKKLESLK